MTERAGILPVDKPVGPTSHDVVAAARRGLRLRRIGHAGTLDPFASGLLLLCIGRATRLAEYLGPLPKTYRAIMRLGAATDTDDRTGTTIATSDAWRDLTPEAIERALLSRVGTHEQIPPAYSARRVAGERLYHAARQGRPIPARPATVTLHSASIVSARLPDIAFEITCGAGFYVRAVARDIGNDLRCHAHLVELRRMRIGPYDVARALSVGELADPERVREAWIEPISALAHLPQIAVDAEQAAALAHGRVVAAPAGAATGITAVAGSGRLVAVAEVREGLMHPRKVFAG